MIRQYSYDSAELIEQIKWLLGSDEWYTEHKQCLRRNHDKVFYLLFNENNVLISMLSVKGNLICDLHTLPEYRHAGNASKLIKNISRPGMRIGTENPFVKKILYKQNFQYLYNRGRYAYYEKS